MLTITDTRCTALVKLRWEILETRGVFVLGSTLQQVCLRNEYY